MGISHQEQDKGMLSNNSWYCNEAIYQIPLQDRNFDSFQPNYPKKMFCGQKHTNQHCHQIWHIQNSLATNFRLKQKMLIFWTKFDQEEYFKTKSRANEWHYQIQYISIRLGSKSHLWQTVLAPLAKFPQKWYFKFKIGKVIIPHNSA